jgi:hypothetical protein
MASAAAAVARLNDIIGRIRELGEATPEFAKDGAAALQDVLEQNIALGRGPDGEKWQLTADGQQPLMGARRGLRVRAVGTRIVATLSGYHANHHLGKTRGNIARPILPSRKLSAPAAKALERVFAERFRKIMGGEG